MKAILKNAWTKHYTQPPNSTLGGLHMTQTIFMILLNGQIPLKAHQSGHAMGGNSGLKVFYPKCLQTWLKIFHSTFPNHLGGFS
jgi:hypothetical protein